MTAVRPDYPVGPDDIVSLHDLGGSDIQREVMVSVVLQAPDPGEFSYARAFIPPFLVALAAGLAVSSRHLWVNPRDRLGHRRVRRVLGAENGKDLS